MIAADTVLDGFRRKARPVRGESKYEDTPKDFAAHGLFLAIDLAKALNLPLFIRKMTNCAHC